ncbi:hypothetical protein Clacol_005193 [Clathrus columnatus]|uniref:Uncharacterized protein n=1 Tax=Clathrus columnatus TaxID=1419009 RepID=A0AAV5A8M2_9AGAM|nr:hypothetical protein Clacol_005193 [Clathrus columnatus]
MHGRKLDLRITSSISNSDASHSPKTTTTGTRRSKRHVKVKREEIKPDSSSSSSVFVPSNRLVKSFGAQRRCSRSRSDMLPFEHEEELSCAHTSKNNVQCNMEHKHRDGSVVGCPTCSSGGSNEIGKDQDMELAPSTSSESTSESYRGEDETSISPVTPVGSLRSFGGPLPPFGGTQMSPYTYYSPLPSLSSFDTPPLLGIDFNSYAYTRSPVYVRDLSPVSSAFSNESLSLYMSTSSIRSTHMLY